MKRLISFVLILQFAFPCLGNAEDLHFDHCKLADANGTQAKAKLISDSTKEVMIRVEGHQPVSIVDFHDQDGKKGIVLKLKEEDLTAIVDSFKARTGKEVIDLGKAGKG